MIKICKILINYLDLFANKTHFYLGKRHRHSNKKMFKHKHPSLIYYTYEQSQVF